MLIRQDVPFTLMSYSFGWRINSAAASPFRGSLGFGYLNNCGRKTSKMLIISKEPYWKWREIHSIRSKTRRYIFSNFLVSEMDG